jgi:hypothetical protein
MLDDHQVREEGADDEGGQASCDGAAGTTTAVRTAPVVRGGGSSRPWRSDGGTTEGDPPHLAARFRQV